MMRLARSASASCSPPPCGVRGERSSLSRSGVGVCHNGISACCLPPSLTFPRKGGGKEENLVRGFRNGENFISGFGSKAHV